MKPLAQLTAMQKATLLHELFPLEVPALLAYMKEVCSGINSYQEIIRQQWHSTWCTADYWFLLSENAGYIIDTYGNQLQKSSRLFARRLFKGYTALFTIGCIVKYASKRSNNEPFIKAVELLFE